MTSIDNLDLKLFDFDYDLTFIVFFLSADEKVYGRYGGRDAEGPDERQSLAGLRYTMNSVLAMHERKDRVFAPREEGVARSIREVAGRRGGRCFHCHQVKEVLNSELRRSGKWQREFAWRYPLPDNLGLLLEVDRGNVVKRVTASSPAAQAGLKSADIVRQVAAVPIHSLADMQFALDRAPGKGKLAVTWERDGKTQTADLSLPDNWRQSDITWRPSMQHLSPSLPVFGPDLTAQEKKTLGLATNQIAFRQKDRVNPRAEAAGIRARDIILGIEGKQLTNMDAGDLYQYVRREFLVGDQIRINLLREGKRLSVPVTLR